MIVVYLSGAFSDNPLLRTLDAIREADRLEAKYPGIIFISPHAMFYWWDQVSGKSYEQWMRYCIALLHRSDVNYRMNQDPSSGADKEELESGVEEQPFVTTDAQLEVALAQLGWTRRAAA